MPSLSEALLPFAGMPPPAPVEDHKFPPVGGHHDQFMHHFVAYTRAEHDPFEGTVTYTPGPASPRVTVAQEDFFELGYHLPNFKGQTFEWTRDETGPFAHPDWMRCNGTLVCLPLKRFIYSPYKMERYLEYLGYTSIYSAAECRYARLSRNPDGTIDNPTRHNLYISRFSETEVIIDYQASFCIFANSENFNV